MMLKWNWMKIKLIQQNFDSELNESANEIKNVIESHMLSNLQLKNKLYKFKKDIINHRRKEKFFCFCGKKLRLINSKKELFTSVKLLNDMREQLKKSQKVIINKIKKEKKIMIIRFSIGNF